MINQNSDGHLSPSGVWIADDFRSNLIIDRYDPVFADMRASKIKHLRSANSEDAITWNVFRSLRQVDPTVWLPTLWKHSFPDHNVPSDPQGATVRLWESVEPPLGLLAAGDEGPSEIDVVIEASAWVWFIEAKFRSDISSGTTVRPDRDQILRNLDVGTHYAGVRRFFFSLLISSENRSPLGMKKLEEYRTLDSVREKLAGHRADRLVNLQGIGHLTWKRMANVLQLAGGNAAREDERCYAKRAWDWMCERKLTE
jgi:hypothetical protein